MFFYDDTEDRLSCGAYSCFIAKMLFNDSKDVMVSLGSGEVRQFALTEYQKLIKKYKKKLYYDGKSVINNESSIDTDGPTIPDAIDRFCEYKIPLSSNEMSNDLTSTESIVKQPTVESSNMKVDAKLLIEKEPDNCVKQIDARDEDNDQTKINGSIPTIPNKVSTPSTSKINQKVSIQSTSSSTSKRESLKPKITKSSSTPKIIPKVSTPSTSSTSKR